MKELAGTGALIRLILRRDRILLPIWILWFAALPTFFATGFAELYPTATERQAFAETAGNNPGMVAIYGPLFDSSIGGLLAWRAGIIPIIVALGQPPHCHPPYKDRGRSRDGVKLLGSTVCPARHAPLAAALIVTVAANLVLATLLALGLMSEDLPAGGSIALGLAFATVGCVFAAVAGVAAQLTEGAGAARGTAISFLGLAVLLRVAGDVSGEDSGWSWLSWTSPIGWAQQARPFADERWWVFVLAASGFVVLAVVAYALSSRRDVGSGLLPPRLGPATASPALRSPLALAWRLHRVLLLGWTAGFVVMGVIFGAYHRVRLGNAKRQPTIENSVRATGRAQAGLADASLSAMMGLLGLVASGYAIQAALRLRAEEEDLRAEPILATSVSRLWWSSSHLLFAIVGPAAALATAGLVAGLIYGAQHRRRRRRATACVGRCPGATARRVGAGRNYGSPLRPTTPVRRARELGCVLGIFLLLGQFGELLQLEQWMLDISPFTHIPNLPGGEVSALPLIWLVVVAVVLTVVGLIGFRRRDIL